MQQMYDAAITHLARALLHFQAAHASQDDVDKPLQSIA